MQLTFQDYQKFSTNHSWYMNHFVYKNIYMLQYTLPFYAPQYIKLYNYIEIKGILFYSC